MSEESYAELANAARMLEKKAKKVPPTLPEYSLQEKDIVLLSPADITQLSYYDLLNEYYKIYKYEVVKTIITKK